MDFTKRMRNRTLFLFASTLVVALSMLLQLPRAEAASQIHVRYQMQTWKNTITAHAPSGHDYLMDVTHYAYYLYWPDGTSVDKVSVYAFQACYRFAPNVPPNVWNSYFNGLKANPYFDDDNEAVNPGSITVPESGADGCKSYTIPVSSRKWFEMSQSPGTSVSGSIVWTFGSLGWPDQGITWKTSDGSTTKFWQPDNDQPGAWDYIDKTW